MSALEQIRSTTAACTRSAERLLELVDAYAMPQPWRIRLLVSEHDNHGAYAVEAAWCRTVCDTDGKPWAIRWYVAHCLHDEQYIVAVYDADKFGWPPLEPDYKDANCVHKPCGAERAMHLLSGYWHTETREEMIEKTRRNKRGPK